MSDRIALGFAIAIVLLIIADFVFFSGGILWFLAKKLLDFIDFVSFWR